MILMEVQSKGFTRKSAMCEAQNSPQKKITAVMLLLVEVRGVYFVLYIVYEKNISLNI